MITHEKIIEILNGWNFWSKTIDAGIERPMYLDLLKRYLETDEVISISGVRRAGKSTLLLQVITHLIKEQNIDPRCTLYINFEEATFAIKPYTRLVFSWH